MKFQLIISDMTADQVGSIVSKITDSQQINVQHMTENEALANQLMTTFPENFTDTESAPTIGGMKLDAVFVAESLPATTVDFDSLGLPWDERIHSGSKVINKDGTFKRRKGISDAEFDAIANTLKGGAPVIHTPTVVTAEPVAPTVMTAPQAPTAPAAPEARPFAPFTPTALPRDFGGLLMQINTLFARGTVTPLYTTTIVARINEAFQSQVINLTDIASDPAKVDYAWQCLGVDGNDK